MMMPYGARRCLSLAFTFVSFLVAVQGLSFHQHVKRQLPTNPDDVRTIVNPLGDNLRYTEPGQLGICETTPGVRSYAGYIDLSPQSHIYFWFFEARENATTAPLTLWLEGGPGFDSMLGVFEELGPCRVDENMQTRLNPDSWNTLSNLLFLSQPIGTGFSYATQALGSINKETGAFERQAVNGTAGRYARPDRNTDTTAKAAVTAWAAVQGIYSALPQMGTNISVPTPFHLWTQSYGGHWGPTFFRYFMSENEKILNGSQPGIPLDMHSLGIISGFIDAGIQMPEYVRYAVNNTYGIQTVPETTLTQMTLSLPYCLDLIQACRDAVRDSPAGREICHSGTIACRDNVELLFDYTSSSNPFDIRRPYAEFPYQLNYVEYLNQPRIQRAMGVNLNYTYFTPEIAQGFNLSGDGMYPDPIQDLQFLLDQEEDNNVRVVLVYGDADYRCNWFGGEAVSLKLNWSGTEAFREQRYRPFVVEGREVGIVREVGNLAFLNMFEAGHLVVKDQPGAALEVFRRVSGMVDLARGEESLVGEDDGEEDEGEGGGEDDGNETVTTDTSIVETMTTTETTSSAESMATAPFV